MSEKKSSGDRSAAPDRGDVIWLDFSPVAGPEQSGRRPALVISPRIFNERRGLALVCPITTAQPHSLFQVQIPEEGDPPVSGVILADQVRMVDFRARYWKPAGRMPEKLVVQILEIVKTLLE